MAQKLNLKSLKLRSQKNTYQRCDISHGKKGTSFISNQAGIHRGLDQKIHGKNCTCHTISMKIRFAKIEILRSHGSLKC